MQIEHSHVLVVGGTGMLREACIHLAARASALTVVARSSAGLRALEQESANAITGISVDYFTDDEFRKRLAQAVQARGFFDLAVAWLHDSAHRALLTISHSIRGAPPRTPRYCQVLDSSTAAPAALKRTGHVGTRALRTRL